MTRPCYHGLIGQVPGEQTLNWLLIASVEEFLGRSSKITYVGLDSSVVFTVILSSCSVHALFYYETLNDNDNDT